MRTERIKTDVLIIGGGTAGCFAAYVIGQKSEQKSSDRRESKY